MPGSLAASSLSFTAPVANQGYTRNPTTASIAASGGGTNTGASTTIQGSIDNFATTQNLQTGYTGGAWSGTMTSIAPGTYTFKIRLANDHSTTATVTPINVGDAFVTVGNSVLNGEAAAVLYNYLTGPGGIKACSYDSITTTWIEPTTRLRQDGNNASSLFQVVLSLLLNDTNCGVPIIVIHCCHDSSDCLGSAGNSAGWAAGNSMYNTALATVASSGITRVTAVVAGGFGVVAAQSANGTVNQAAYAAAYSAMADGFAANFPGAPKTVACLPGSVQDATGMAADLRANTDACRMAEKGLWGTGNVLRGPVWSDMGFQFDAGHIHPVENVDMLTMGSRLYLAIMDEFYGQSFGRGPQVVTLILSADKTRLRVLWDQDLLPAVASAAQYLGGKIYDFGSTSSFTRAASCFRVRDSGTPVTISTVTQAALREMTFQFASPVSAAANLEVDFGSWNDAVSSLVYSDLGGDVNADSAPYGASISLPVDLPDGGSFTADHIYQPAEPFLGQVVTAEGSGGGSGGGGSIFSSGIIEGLGVI